MIIGTFFTTDYGYQGHIKTLALSADVRLVAGKEKKSENAPDWLLFLSSDHEDVEIGAGWNRTGKKAGDYISLQIDDPILPQPMRAILVKGIDETTFDLIWTRPSARSKKS